MSYTINSGVGVDRRIDDLFLAMNKMSRRISALEDLQDAKSEPESLPIGHSLSKEQIADKLLFTKQLQIDELSKNVQELKDANKYWTDRSENLLIQNNDLKWRLYNPDMVECQTARKCLGIVSKIKNEPLTTMSPSREWMVAICEDIERVIKQEFGLK